MMLPPANVIVRVGSAWMGCSGSGAETEEGGWGLIWMSEDECIGVGPGADPDSWSGGATLAAHKVAWSNVFERC